MKDWNPDLYRRFETERTRPAAELLARVPLSALEGGSISDLGCGPGNSTELLFNAAPHTRITGIDTSEAMLSQARLRLPSCDFQQADIRFWRPQQPQNLIYANASLQWITDHAALLPHLVRQLTADGVLAIQMPDNLEQPSHRLMRKVAMEGEWRTKIGEAERLRERLLSAESYYDLLVGQGCRVDIWRTTYYHVMPSAQAIVDWLRATGLRPFLNALDEGEQATFLQRYLSELQQVYCRRQDHSVLLAFPRLFIVAQRRQDIPE